MSTDEELIEGLRKGVESGEWVEVSRIPQPQGALWVCQRCLLAREASEEQEPCGCAASHEPWNREPTTDVTMGVLEHADGCTEEGRAEGCDCATDQFSWRACDACGCPLAGDRHAYTWWA